MAGSASQDIRVPHQLALLDGPSSALARAGAGDERLFSLSGRRANAWGSGLRGVAEIHAAGWTLLSELATGLGPASNVVVDPSSVRREVADAAGTVLETLLLAVRAPAAILQWRRPEGSSARLALELHWSFAWNEGADVSFESLPDCLRVSARATGFERLAPCALLVARPEPRWDVQAQSGGLRLSATLTAGAGEAISLLLAGGATEGEALAALQVVAAPRTEEVRAEQAVQRAKQEGLATHTGVAALDEGLEWAKARVRAAIEEATARAGDAPESHPSRDEHGTRRIRRGTPGAYPPEGPSAAWPTPWSPRVEDVWIALGALAAGDPEPAEVVLEGDLETPYHLLLAARCVAWTGASGVLFSNIQRLDTAVARTAAANPSPIAAAAFRELAEAWESFGEKSRAAVLRAFLDGMPRAALGDARRLPMVGAHPRASAAETLATALVGASGRFYPTPSAEWTGSLERGLRAWAMLRSGDPEAGYRALREHLEAGFRRGWGLWSETLEASDPEPSLHDVGSGARALRAPWIDHTASAALIPCALLFGMLGASADAPVGRLRLAPRLPAAWRTFDVTGICVGDAMIALSYRRSGGEHVFRIRQDSGRVPLMLVFEPQVPEIEIEAALVEGTGADLAHLSARGRTSVRVQLPLDHDREITLVGKRIAGTP